MSFIMQCKPQITMDILQRKVMDKEDLERVTYICTFDKVTASISFMINHENKYISPLFDKSFSYFIREFL